MSPKEFFFRLLGKDPEAVIVSFLSGPERIARAMVAEVRALVPDREHYAVTDLDIPGIVCIPPSELPGPLKRKRIGLAPTLFTGEPAYRSLRRTAFRFAPHKILAYNARLERHHLRLRTLIASILFLRGVPLDRIYLRPTWLFPFKRDRSVWPQRHEVLEGRPAAADRRRVAILSPYFPYPLSHGGAVRIFNLIREASRDFDVFLFSFAEDPDAASGSPLLELCARLILFPSPRYREPRWASLLPPEVKEYSSPYVSRTIQAICRQHDVSLMQVEYAQLASYGRDILVEHDVTFDLYQQLLSGTRTLSAWWNYWRWRRYESRMLRRYRRVVVMSEKDAGLLGVPQVRVIPNGVDLTRFRPEPEASGSHLLFVGSFRHFPNVGAYRFFTEEVWPLIAHRPGLRFTVIAGPDPELYWSERPADDRIELLGFVSDVRPFYAAANIVVVPTQVSAGTNLKVLEAMAAGRAVVSTTAGCAGLGVRHTESVWIADTAADFAGAIQRLLDDVDLRHTIARHGRHHVEREFGWAKIGAAQKQLWMELLTGVTVRVATRSDLPAISRIQAASQSASHWEPPSYFDFHVSVAERGGSICGFMVTREVGGEIEVLNLAVDPAHRRTGVATCLLQTIPANFIYLEVRESNEAARKLYSKLGFQVIGLRKEYYDNPVESALVMRLSRQNDHATF